MSDNLRQAVPFFMVRDIEASAKLFVDGLGFRRTHEWIDAGRLRWCWLERGGAAVMLQQYWNGGPHTASPPAVLGAGVSVYFICSDAVAFWRECTARGVDAARPFVGNRMWVTGVTTPDGYQLFFESPTDVADETVYSESA